jgi:two-component system response regulator DctR
VTTEQSVFIVEGESLARDMIVGVAKSMGVSAEGYDSAENFLARFDRTHGGCLVLDLWLGGMSGVDLLDVMGRDGICLPTIVVTASVDVPLVVQVMQSGVLTVLEKPFRVQELRDALRQALSLDAQRRHNGARAVDVRSQLASLTPDERRVLDLILAGKTNKEISKELALRLRTVEARRQSLMAKLKAGSLAELVQVVTEFRLLFSAPFARAGLLAAARQSSVDDPRVRETELVR